MPAVVATAVVATAVVATAVVATAVLVISAVLIAAPGNETVLITAPGNGAVLVMALLSAAELATVLAGLLAAGLRTLDLVFSVSPVVLAPGSPCSSLAMGPKACEVEATGDRGVGRGDVDAWDLEEVTALPAFPNVSICSFQRSSGILASVSSASSLLTTHSSAISGASLVIPTACPNCMIST